jgi:glutathione S-transferase
MRRGGNRMMNVLLPSLWDQAMLKIWGRLNSINVQKVVWCADETGAPYERIEAGREFGIVNTPEYLAKNPNGLVPMIEDDGLVLWESNAVVRYLSARYAEGTLSPKELKARANTDRWMDWQATTFNPPIGQVFTQLIRTPEAQRDMAAVETNRQTAEKRLAMLDAHLAKQDYVAGDGFTMADIPLGLSVHRWLRLPVQREPRPNVERWYARLKDRKGAQQTLAVPLT